MHNQPLLLDNFLPLRGSKITAKLRVNPFTRHLAKLRQ